MAWIMKVTKLNNIEDDKNGIDENEDNDEHAEMMQLMNMMNLSVFVQDVLFRACLCTSLY